jgi:Na+/H+ antiporter NhaD/arsenite permease-like protein
MVHAVSATGAIDYAAHELLVRTGGKRWKVLVALMLVTAVLSAFLDNLTTVLVMAPIGLRIARAVESDPVRLIIAIIFASNIGGTATLIGDPPNIIIGAATGLTFMEFIQNLAPIVVIVLLIVGTGLVWITQRAEAKDDLPEHDLTAEQMGSPPVLSRGLEMWVPVTLLLGSLVLFFLHTPLHLKPFSIALGGAALTLLLTPKISVVEELHKVDWATIMFFAALFVMVGGLESAGVLEQVAEGVGSATGDNEAARLVAIIWASGIGSGFTDNIPFTAAMVPVVDQLTAEGSPGNWWALSLGACFGGNLTTIAAAANVAAIGIADEEGVHVSFFRFLKWGLPVTFISLVMASVYVVLRYT